MRVLKIASREIKENFRSKKAMVFMVLFPIVLMTILGFAFSNTFNSDHKISNINVEYTDNGSKELSKGFNNFVDSCEKLGIGLHEVKEIASGINDVRNVKYNCAGYIVLRGNNIVFYKNDRDFVDTNIVETILKAFVDRFNVVAVVAKENPQSLSKINVSDNYDFTEIVSLNSERQPSSYDYYSITMLTLIILYGSISGIYSINSERVKNTGNRMLTTLAKKHEILLGKILGSSLSVFLQSILVFLYSRFILKAYWGNDIYTITLIIISEIIFSISLGICLGFLFKNSGVASGIVNAIIPFIAFLGGSYFSVDAAEALFKNLSNISPIKWTNSAILNVAFANSYNDVLAAIIINLACAFVFVFLAAYLFRKEAF